jgi:hypothetical protein
LNASRITLVILSTSINFVTYNELVRYTDQRTDQEFPLPLIPYFLGRLHGVDGPL